MSGVNIGWNESSPAVSDLAGNGYQVINSLKSNVRGALDAEHEFPSTGGVAGSHRTGSARAYYGTESRVSAVENGRLMVSSDKSRLFHVGSAGTMYLGGNDSIAFRDVLAAAYLSPSQRSRYEIEHIFATTGSNGSVGVTYVSSFGAGMTPLVDVWQTGVSTVQPIVFQTIGNGQSAVSVYAWNLSGVLQANIAFGGIAIGVRALG